MESRIVELRQRSRQTVRRTARLAALGAGVAAALAVAAGVVFVTYRMRRPPTFAERLGRVLPSRFSRLSAVAQAARLWAGRRVPPVRLYVGDRQVGEAAPTTRWEKIGLRFAQTFATAAASALVSRLTARLLPRR
ncbi:MAG: hypothetical protein ACREPI_08615 [Candidatus Dormibacterales bacterium]